MLAVLRALLLRELRALRASVDAYPDDAAVWATAPGITNTGGTIVLHVCGNLQHFIGAVLGHSEYLRDRDAEFNRRDVARSELVAEIDAAMRAVDRTLSRGDDGMLEREYPQEVSGRVVSTGVFLAHLVSHTAYHLGQLDYHRRAVTGDAKSIGAVSLADLAVEISR